MWFRELSGKCCSISFLTINPSSSRLTSTNVSFALLSLCCYHSRWHRYAPKSCQAATDRQSTWTPLIWRVPVFRDHSRGQPWMCSITVPAAANANSSGNGAALSVVLAAVFIRTKDSDGGGEGRGGEGRWSRIITLTTLTSQIIASPAAWLWLRRNMAFAAS